MSDNTSTTESTTSTTEFFKIERPQFDTVLKLGTPEFAARIPTLTDDELKRAERYADARRTEKGPNTYLVFPVRKEKQQAAGVLYFKALNSFRRAVREEAAQRAGTAMLAEPVAQQLELAVA